VVSQYLGRPKYAVGDPESRKFPDNSLLIEFDTETSSLQTGSPTSLRSLRELRLGKPASALVGEASEGCCAEARRAEAGHVPLMTYVYILRSLDFPDRFYVGITDDLRSRLRKHNAGEVSHTSKYAPWAIKTYIAFSDKAQAFKFEKYLKSPSGRAFAKKRL
jgi:putative endonuclease